MTAGIIKIGVAISIVAGACSGAPHKTPVVDPKKWDPTMYCQTIQPPADPWCVAHGHPKITKKTAVRNTAKQG